MIIIIHGDDLISSRKALEQEKLKDEGNEMIYLNGKESALSDLVTAVSSLSLFQNKKTIIIENLFSSGISKAKEELFDYLKKNNQGAKIVIWEKSEISKSSVKKYLGEVREIFCNFPLLLFKFLDSIGFDKTLSLSLFRSSLKQREAELIFTMILRQIRLLIVAKDMGAKGLDAMQKWQIFKLEKQARLFSLEELIKIYRRLLLIYYQIKTGQTPLNMSELLDIFLTSL